METDESALMGKETEPSAWTRALWTVRCWLPSCPYAPASGEIVGILKIMISGGQSHQIDFEDHFNELKPGKVNAVINAYVELARKHFPSACNFMK